MQPAVLSGLLFIFIFFISQVLCVASITKCSFAPSDLALSV